MTRLAGREDHKKPINMNLGHNCLGSALRTEMRRMLTEVNIPLTEVNACFHLETLHQLHSRPGASRFAAGDRRLDPAAAARSETPPQPVNREPDNRDGICDAGNALGPSR